MCEYEYEADDLEGLDRGGAVMGSKSIKHQEEEEEEYVGASEGYEERVEGFRRRN